MTPIAVAIPREALAEAQDIVRNAQNPKHKLFWSGDKATREEVDGLFRAAVPGEQE